MLVAAVVLVQVHLIGAHLFGTDHGELDGHQSLDFAVLPSLALAVLGGARIALVETGDRGGALHPLPALVVLTIAVLLVQSALARCRAAVAAA